MKTHFWTLFCTAFLLLLAQISAYPFSSHIAALSDASRGVDDGDTYSPDLVEASAGCIKCRSSLNFSSKEAMKYEVGTDIPTLPFKTKNAWAGLIPISPNTNDSFYFYLWGNDGPHPSQEIVIWTNGGPGCSSLLGLLQENGPFLYLNKHQSPYVNPYSWTKEAIMLYVELPVGVGFTTGNVITYDEEELSQQFATFLDNFFTIFTELQGKKLYIAAESYGAIYSSYIMHNLYKSGNKHNLQGGMIVSGLFSTRVAQMDLVAYDFAVRWASTLGLTRSDLLSIKKQSDLCGYTGYTQKNLLYPPRGRLPPFNELGCRTSFTLFNHSLEKRKDFNPYRITIPDPALESPLGDPYAKISSNTFFDDANLQKYIHAPAKKWNECTRAVFPGGDRSLPPDQYPSYRHSILASVVENSPAGLIFMTGRQDAMVITEGTSLVLQNLTWANVQGFQSKPNQTLIDTTGKVAGTWIKERGLTYVIVDDAGHSIPTDAPSTSFLALQVMLGRRTFAGRGS